MASTILQSTRVFLLLRAVPVKSQRALSMTNLLKPEIVLSEKNRASCIDNLTKYQKNLTLTELDDVKTNNTHAAVLVPLCVHNGELGLLYTLRSSKLNSNRGQVSFPGGIRDKKDKSFEETALRETWEELKIPKEKVDIWTSANPINRRNMIIVPILGYIGNVEPEKLEINPDEVEEAFVLSLRTLCEPTSCHFTQFRDQYTMPVYLSDRYRIWGLTGLVTHLILKALVPSTYKHKLVYIPSVDRSERSTKSSREV